jgi:hypothetical protein
VSGIRLTRQSMFKAIATSEKFFQPAQNNKIHNECTRVSSRSRSGNGQGLV